MPFKLINTLYKYSKTQKKYVPIKTKRVYRYVKKTTYYRWKIKWKYM